MSTLVREWLHFSALVCVFDVIVYSCDMFVHVRGATAAADVVVVTAVAAAAVDSHISLSACVSYLFVVL